MKHDNAKKLPEKRIPKLIFGIMLEMRTLYDRRMAPYGLTFRQAALLIRCVRKGGAQLNELVSHMNTDNASISRLADRLEAAGFVTREPGSDRRSVILKPTPKGSALCPELEQVMEEVDQEVLSGFSPEETDRFRASLYRIFKNVKHANNDTIPKE